MSAQGIVADRPSSGLQVSNGGIWGRRSNSEFVAYVELINIVVKDCICLLDGIKKKNSANSIR